MCWDRARIDFLEKELQDSGYSIDILHGKNLLFDRIILRLRVGSGPWQKEFSGVDLRTCIDKAIKII